MATLPGHHEGVIYRNETGTGTMGNAPPLSFTRDSIKALHESVVDRKSISVKAAVNSTDAGMAGVSGYRLNPYPFLRDRVRVLDSIPVQTTDRSSVTFYKLTTGAVNAATVAEGATKPTSSPVWSSAVATVRKLAHVASVTDR